jgi:hypothetical protein
VCARFRFGPAPVKCCEAERGRSVKRRVATGASTDGCMPPQLTLPARGRHHLATSHLPNVQVAPTTNRCSALAPLRMAETHTSGGVAFVDDVASSRCPSGPDQALYILTDEDNGQLLRIVPR